MQAPGPSAARFIYRINRRGFLETVRGFWHEYGDTFQIRIGKRTLIVALHPQAVEYVNLTARDKYGKGASFAALRKYLTGDGLVSSTGELWRRQRKLMSPFFTPRGVRAYSDLMLSHAEQLRERWQGLASVGSEVEISEEMTSVTAAIILRAMFSTASLESIDQIADSVGTMVRFVARQSSGLVLPLWVPTRLNRRYVVARSLVQRLITEIISKRRALEESAWPDDLLTRLMQARDESTAERMSESLLRDEAITIFFAGHETTARTMTFAWYALANNPAVAARLHAELDGVVGGRTLTTDDLRQLVYTQRVIKEVMRLYPPAAFYSRDALVADQLGGFDVPEGAMVLLSPYYTHRHPGAWKDPERFEPDRWEHERDLPTGAFHPFAIGPRTCLGNHFSLLESHVLLAVLAQRFKPRLRPDYQPQWRMEGPLELVGGLPMVIVPR